jgi:ABC-type transport system involved in Fe-S cluster assembly fused permease/ATPase subunit
MDGVLRLIAGFAIAAAFTAGWLLLAVVTMFVCLYIVRLIPMTGWRRSSRRSEGAIRRP